MPVYCSVLRQNEGVFKFKTTIISVPPFETTISREGVCFLIFTYFVFTLRAFVIRHWPTSAPSTRHFSCDNKSKYMMRSVSIEPLQTSWGPGSSPGIHFFRCFSQSACLLLRRASFVLFIAFLVLVFDRFCMTRAFRFLQCFKVMPRRKISLEFRSNFCSDFETRRYCFACVMFDVFSR